MSLVSALPPNIEHLTINAIDSASVELCELLDHIQDFSSLKKLDIGWQTFVYPDRPSSINADIHPGFTPDDALKFMDLCEAAGIKVENCG